MALSLEVESLSFPSSGPLLANSRLRVEAGESLAILGGSGSGKTLLMTLLAGLHPEPLGGRLLGSVTLDGRPLQGYAQAELLGRIGYMGSNPRVFLTGFCHSVQEEVAWSLLAMGLPISQVEARVQDLLEQLDMIELSAVNPAELSGESSSWSLWRASWRGSRAFFFWTSRSTAWMYQLESVSWMLLLRSGPNQGSPWSGPPLNWKL